MNRCTRRYSIKATAEGRDNHIALLIGLSLTALPVFDIFLAGVANAAGFQESGLFLAVSTATVCVLTYLAARTLRAGRPQSLVVALIPAVVLVGLATLVSTITDLGYDSNGYHKVGVGALAQGWNPARGSIEGWASGAQPAIGALASTWVDHYPHGGWQFSSGVVEAGGVFESGKVLTLLTSLAVGMIAFWLFRTLLGLPSRLAVATLLALNPVASVQAFSFTIDGALGNLVIMLVLLLLGYLDSANSAARPLILLGVALSTIAILDLKFTGLFFAGSYLLLASAMVLFRVLRGNEQWKTFWLLVATAGASAVAATTLVAGSPYVTNLVDHKNPFYPASGSSTIDIMRGQRPPGFASLSNAERYIISNFSASEDLQEKSGRQPRLKAPFTWTPAWGDLSQFRVAGYGQWFGGCLLLTTAALLYGVARWPRHSPFWRSVLLVVAFTMLLGFVSPESWWARLYPQLPLVVPLIAAFLVGTKQRVAGAVIMLALAVNTAVLAGTHLANITKSSEEFRTSVDAKICGQPLELSTKDRAGILYSVIDRCGPVSINTSPTASTGAQNVTFWIDAVRR